MQTVIRPPDPGFVPTLPNLIANAAQHFGDHVCLVQGNTSLTYTKVDALSAELARGLLALGLGKGSRIGMVMPNSIDWVLCWLAAGRIGALTQPLSTLYKAPELAWSIAHLDIDTLLVTGNYLNNSYIERLEDALPGLRGHSDTRLFLPDHPYLRRIIVWGACDRPWALKGPAALQQAATATPQIDAAFLAKIEASVAPADALVMISTSGSTANPKTVVHTHGATVRVPYAFLDYIDFVPQDRNLAAQPLFWIGGLNTNLIPALHIGATLVLADGPKHEDLLKAIEDHKVTRIPWWPLMLKELSELAAARGSDVSGLRQTFMVPTDAHGQVIPPDQRSIPFGMTETFGMHTIEARSLALPTLKRGANGRALPGIERRIVDLDTGLEVAPGEPGELQVRGYSVMQGYYKREREDVFLPDGYFATGDICSIDPDGFLYFHSRRDDMIKTAGANVSPAEVERVLAADPAVSEAIVFGLPHPARGEAVVAVIVLKPGHTLDTAALKLRVLGALSSYKVPQDIFAIEAAAVPRTASAKINKPQLAQTVAKMVRW
jgi:acyl-CoA synthetase (AMP-forming)/AMP-acid ligase II